MGDTVSHPSDLDTDAKDNQDAMIAAGADVLLPKEAVTVKLCRVIQEALKPRMLNVD
jgi:hypothetical protein